jgi:hypothetical protein
MTKLISIELSEMNVLLDLTHKYMIITNETVRTNQKNYFDGLIKLDLSNSFFKIIKEKIGKTKKYKPVNIFLSVSQAVILLDICQNNDLIKNEFEKYVATKTINQLHGQLINL